MVMEKFTPQLRSFATPRQLEIMDAIESAGSYRKAAEELGIHRRTLERSMATVKLRAAASGYAPEYGMTKQVPSPFVVKGVSTLYNAEGEISGQWVKSTLSQELYLESIKDAVQSFLEEVDSVPASAAPDNFERDVIPWFQIGDAHLGMLAHESETGDNFDLKIAERELCSAIALLFDQTGTHERCVINDLGDFTHYENFSATTEASGHALDFDTRFPKMIKCYSRIMRFIVDSALKKFKYVDIIINQGNHSRTNDIWMAELIRVAYGHTGRVNVLNNDNVFIPYRMGNTFVMTHHSDKCKPLKLAQVMATDYAKDWGESKFRYIDIGHIHHNMILKEFPGVSVESFNILAPKDKWAHDSGYRSRQSITVIERSRTYGEIGRRTLPIDKVKDNLLKNFTQSQQKTKTSQVFTV
jgi:hypothetical protein